MALQAIIFDLDGTLIDSAAITGAILTEMLADRGVDRVVTPAEARPLMTHEGSRVVAALLGPDARDPEVDVADFRARYAVHPTPRCAFPGVADGLSGLRRAGYPLGIASNKPEPLCVKVLGDLGLLSLFDAVAGLRADVRPKPAPDLLVDALDRIGVAAPDALYVGDSELDHAAAAAAGVPFLYAGWGYGDPTFARPTLRRAAAFADVLAAIDRALVVKAA